METAGLFLSITCCFEWIKKVTSKKIFITDLPVSGIIYSPHRDRVSPNVLDERKRVRFPLSGQVRENWGNVVCWIICWKSGKVGTFWSGWGELNFVLFLDVSVKSSVCRYKNCPHWPTSLMFSCDTCQNCAAGSGKNAPQMSGKVLKFKYSWSLETPRKKLSRKYPQFRPYLKEMECKY